MNDLSHHIWIRGGARSDREAFVRSLALPSAIVPTLDAHRRLRGPYTAAGSLARALVPVVLEADPDLVAGHDIELLCAAPDLHTIVPNSRETLTSMAIPQERTRFYARLRTRRIANGLVDFLRDSLPEGQPGSLMVENVDQADQTDLEFLAALIRRVDPGRLTVVLCSGSADLPDAELLSVVGVHARTCQLPSTPAAAGGSPGPVDASGPIDGAAAEIGDRHHLAWIYVATDCTADDQHLVRAYDALSVSERTRLHERRAADLATLDSQPSRLGAIPYHLERGHDPAGAGAEALYSAQDYSLCMGFYSAVVDYGYRALDIVDCKRQPDLWWRVTIELTLALSILSRTAEAEHLYDQARVLSIDPTVHMAAAYSTAMLYTRHNDPEDRDEEKAKAWLNSAIATASFIADPSERAFQSAFYKNGLALVEVNLGEPTEALRLVNECIDRLDHELADDEHRLHRSVLKNNRARVLSSLGRLDDALADYAIVIAEDPNHAEHYLERGNILRRLGRSAEAFADYTTAMRLSPPFPEIYYNRGDLRLATGDTAGALADFSYVLDIEPDFVDAYVNRAGMYLQSGDLDAAGSDAAAGLRHDAQNPHLHVVAGYVHLAHQDYPDAEEAFASALAADPDMIAALSGRAQLACETGQIDVAIADLGRAVELEPDDPALRYNRAFAYQSAGRWDDALRDLDVAARLAPDDPDVTSARELCLGMVAV